MVSLCTVMSAGRGKGGPQRRRGHAVGPQPLSQAHTAATPVKDRRPLLTNLRGLRRGVSRNSARLLAVAEMPATIGARIRRRWRYAVVVISAASGLAGL